MDKVLIHGKCRCCSVEGSHRDIMKEYFSDGSREVYFDMFLECFNLFLSSLREASTLICSECVQKLRDANMFRIMVVRAEGLLQAACKRNEFVVVKESIPESHNEQDIKLEQLEVKAEPQDLDFMDYADFDADGVEDGKKLMEDEARLVSRFPRDSLRRLPTRDTLYELCPKYVMELDMLQGKKTYPKQLEGLIESDEDSDGLTEKRRKIFIPEKHAQVSNATTLLEFSNATPFKGKSRSGLPCFYCKDILEDIKQLRTHQYEKHKNIDIRKTLSSHSVDCFIVNVDITDLKCKICDDKIDTLKELKVHLSKHGKKIYTEFEDRVIPFKIPADNNFICQICQLKFETFGSIERHMNMHFRNYICDNCGTGFVTNYRMKMHIKTMHVAGCFHCEICGKIFPSHQKHKAHVDTVHKCVKRFKCAKCSERFTDYFKRHQHMVEKHGVAELQYKCNVCDKVYSRRYMLSRHMKRDHLEERYFQCDICFNKFFARRDLESHMVKHNGERIFECSVCKKSYARKKTLTEHMRIHNNDRRFSCSVCGQAFVQNCSLKGHIKTHHPEFVQNGNKILV